MVSSEQTPPGGAGEASETAQALVTSYGMACGVLCGPLGTRNLDLAASRCEQRERALLAYIAELERRAGAREVEEE